VRYVRGITNAPNGQPWHKVFLASLGKGAANFADDRGTQMAASISYFTLFSLFPLTLLSVAIFGIVLRDADVQARVLELMSEVLPLEENTVENLLGRAAELGPTVGVISLVAALWSAGALSAAIRQAMNVAFEVRVKRPMLLAKLIDFVLLPVIAIPLAAGVVLSAIWRFFQQQLDEQWGLFDGNLAWLWDVGAVLIPLTMSFIAFAALYRIAPGKTHPWRYIAPGALIAAVLFELLKGGFGFYLQNFFNENIYGSLGSAIILLFWVYLSANILIFGGEVAAAFEEAAHAKQDEDDEDDVERDWKQTAWKVLRGLIMVPEEEDPDAPKGRRARRAAAVGSRSERGSAAG